MQRYLLIVISFLFPALVGIKSFAASSFEYTPLKETSVSKKEIAQALFLFFSIEEDDDDDDDRDDDNNDHAPHDIFNKPEFFPEQSRLPDSHRLNERFFCIHNHYLHLICCYKI